MQDLLDACLFKHEGAFCSPVSTRIDIGGLRRYVDRGRARLIPIGEGLVSVAVKEGSQGDVGSLPCGARSLILDAGTGEIHVRGINKFFDMEDVSSAWLSDPLVWTSATCSVYALRKMAGFVVTLYSTDGVALRCMSKHVLDGLHVEMATAILASLLTERQRRAVARQLWELDATASCECISRTQDFHHPMLEDERFANTVVLFAVQKRRSLQERSLPFEEVTRLAAAWGVPCTPGCRLTSAREVEMALEATHKWDATYEPLAPPPRLGEGLVVLVEVRCDGDTGWVRPVRLKAKTAAYITARALRSLLRGDSQPRLLLYHKAVLAWALLHSESVADLRKTEADAGVSEILSAFEASVRERVSAQPRRRYRGASLTEEEAYCALLAVTSRQIFGKALLPHETQVRGLGGRRPLITMVLLCGLPGSGKSTLCAGLAEVLSAGKRPCPYGYVVTLSRDTVTSELSALMGITAESSKHKRRRLGYPVHREIRRQLDLVRQFALGADAPVLLLFDACNATPEARHVWRTTLPPHLVTCYTVWVQCTNASELAARVGARRTHELLSDPAEAQRALYTLRNKFVPPAPGEGAAVCDTATEPLGECVTRLAALVCDEWPEAQCDRKAQVLTMLTLEAALQKADDDILHGLLGVERWSAREAAALAPLLSTAAAKRREETVVVLTVDAPMEELRGCAADALAGQLCPGAPSTLARTLVAGLRSVLFGGARPSVLSAALVAGHTAWLRGWLFRGRSADCSRESLARALAERFEQHLTEPHVTLLYSPDGRAGVEAFWTDSGLKAGQRVRFTATEVLLDRFGVCLGVELVDWERSHQWQAGAAQEGAEPTVGVEEANEDETEPHAGPRLHLTLGTARGVKGGYCGDMFTDFPAWEASNVALKARKAQNTATRSQDKFMNFVHLRLQQPLVLWGTVAEL